MFWDCSLQELAREFEAARWRQTDRRALVWMTAALMRAQKLPDYAKFAAPPAVYQQHQTPEEQRAVLHQWSARLGIPLERIPWRPHGESGERRRDGT